MHCVLCLGREISLHSWATWNGLLACGPCVWHVVLCFSRPGKCRMQTWLEKRKCTHDLEKKLALLQSIQQDFKQTSTFRINVSCYSLMFTFFRIRKCDLWIWRTSIIPPWDSHHFHWITKAGNNNQESSEQIANTKPYLLWSFAIYFIFVTTS